MTDQFILLMVGGIMSNYEHKLNKNDVVQFNENHKWCGCIGMVDEIKSMKDDTRYLIGIPIPVRKTIYIFVKDSENALEYIGQAIMVEGDSDDIEGCE